MTDREKIESLLDSITQHADEVYGMGGTIKYQGQAIRGLVVQLRAALAEPTEAREPDDHERICRRFANAIGWLEQHHPEVFREGIWDAMERTGDRP